ncbi:MAG: aspartate aminotransferase family protein [Spirochaetes bacterium]|nr:aspartate aminotransferase family protein [Spirochaetota bacterium]
MNIVIQKEIDDRKELLQDAAAVFSKGYVDMITAEGIDLIEEGGRGTRLYDMSGLEYLDCDTSGAIYNLGRGRRELGDALREAARQTDQGNFIAISEEKALLAEKLSSFIPGRLECFLFTVVRGEAMDAACKLARGYTKRAEIITVDGGWYGHTGFSLCMSAREDKHLFGPGIPGIKEIPFGDIDAAKKTVNSKTAAVVLETVQAENGCRHTAGEYYSELRKLCSRSGAVLIVDESQTGFGRTGERFSFERFGFEPDIAVLGEAITGGMFPMTAMAFTRKLKSFFDDHPLIHLCTFGGHDVGCRVAVKALELYESERSWENAQSMGDMLHSELCRIARDNIEMIGGVRGIGLLQSITLKDEEITRRFCVEARKAGLICMRGRVDRRSVVFRPSLAVTREDVQQIVECVKISLDNVA